jgi:hypothetical protein
MKKTSLILLIFMILFATYACQNSRYNNNPDIASKGIESDSGISDRIVPTSMEQVVAHATDIVIGSVADDRQSGTFSISGIKAVDEKIAGVSGSAQSDCTLSKITVEQVIMGDLELYSSITYFQLGSPGNNKGQIKVKKGDRILIMLRPSDTDVIYYAGNCEESVFNLNDHNRLTSQSDFLICARYDGIALDILLEDIKLTTQFVKIQNAIKSK